MNAPELFKNSHLLPSGIMLWTLLPLCLVVSIIYKTIRIPTLGRLWWEILSMFGYIVCLLIAMGTAAWLIVTYWP
jgi:uncharacterized membrane protein YGL010W